jgi:hypothetical protein
MKDVFCFEVTKIVRVNSGTVQFTVHLSSEAGNIHTGKSGKARLVIQPGAQQKRQLSDSRRLFAADRSSTGARPKHPEPFQQRMAVFMDK